MSYIVNQKIGNNYYVYKTKSVWDKQKKQPRQQRIYIGKRDLKTGKIITPKKSLSPKTSRLFGQVYFLKKLAEKTGLLDALKEVYGEIYEDLLNLSFYQICESKPMYLFKDWAESTYLNEVHYYDSQRISEFLKEIGEKIQLKELFFKKWSEKQENIKGIIFDITSISSYSKLIEIMEWGYNREGDKLPQVNFGVVFGQPSNLPLLYKIYPGSIPDVSTLKGIIEKNKEIIKIQNYMYILDRGFYSKSNIEELNKEGLRFIIPLPFTTKASEELNRESEKSIRSPINCFYEKKRALFYLKRPVQIGDVKLQAHVYLDEKRRAEEIEILMRNISEIESAVQERASDDKEKIQEYIETNLGVLSKLLKIEKKGGRNILRRNENEFNKLISRMGKIIIITNDKTMKKEEVINLYKRRDKIEKLFEILKTEIEERRLRISSKAALDGKIFINYITLILYSSINNLMKEKNLNKEYTIAEILYEFKKLSIVKMNDEKEKLTEITKRQRRLFELFNIEIPDKHSY